MCQPVGGWREKARTASEQVSRTKRIWTYAVIQMVLIKKLQLCTKQVPNATQRSATPKHFHTLMMQWHKHLAIFDLITKWFKEKPVHKDLLYLTNLPFPLGSTCTELTNLSKPASHAPTREERAGPTCLNCSWQLHTDWFWALFGPSVLQPKGRGMAWSRHVS